MKSFGVDIGLQIMNQGVDLYHFDEADIYVEGFIYSYGRKEGKETIEWLYEEIIAGKNIPYGELCGAFSCLIKLNQKIVVFSDNSNMHCIYYTDHFVSNSFLKTVEAKLKNDGFVSFDIDSLCEYLTIGNIFFGKTFFHDVSVLDSSNIIIIQDGGFSIIPKGIDDIDQNSDLLSISDFFSKVAYSISERVVCQALTGGYDSRMIYACLSSKIKDHATISSNSVDLSDVKCAIEVAKENNDELEVISIPKPDFSEDMLNAILQEADGIEPLDIDTYVRLSTFKNLLSKKYNMLLTGDGGVLHKDWEWTQDLPFYRKKRSDPKKFYRQRLCYLNIQEQVGDEIRGALTKQEERFIEELNKIKKPLNTQSYDSWYYKVSGNRRFYYNHTPDNGIIMYAPLMELDIVRYSYALPRHKRFFYNSIRDTISNENKQIARLRTNYGTTASNEPVYMVRDAFCQLGEYAKKAYRLFGRKILNKNVMVDSFTGWSLENDVRKSEIAGKALEFAIQRGLIKTDMQQERISFEVLTRLLHVYWLARETQNA